MCYWKIVTKIKSIMKIFIDLFERMYRKIQIKLFLKGRERCNDTNNRDYSQFESFLKLR